MDRIFLRNGLADNFSNPLNGNSKDYPRTHLDTHNDLLNSNVNQSSFHCISMLRSRSPPN